MMYTLSCLWLMLVGLNALEQGKEPIDTYRDALSSPYPDPYLLTFDVSYKRFKDNEIYENTVLHYTVASRGNDFYSEIVRVTNGKSFISKELVNKDGAIYYNSEFPRVQRFIGNNPERNSQHKIDIRRIGRIPMPLITSNIHPLSEYLSSIKIPLKRTEVSDKVTYDGVYPNGTTVTYSFLKGDSSYPTSIIQRMKVGDASREMIYNVYFTDGQSLPSKVEYIDKMDGITEIHQILDNIQVKPLPTDYNFTDSKLDLPQNTQAEVNGGMMMYWNGDKFVDLPTQSSRSRVLVVSTFFLFNGIALVLIGLIVMYLHLARKKKILVVSSNQA